MTCSSDPTGLHDFAFQTGRLDAFHRKLAHRLLGDASWVECGGTCQAFEILGGAGNVDDFFIDEPAGSYRAATFRRLEAGTGEWSIHWADARRTGVDPPMRGRFAGGVGTFFGHDELDGKAIKVRFVWSEIRADHARWEQAFSLDGRTWEVNWVMHFNRTALSVFLVE